MTFQQSLAIMSEKVDEFGDDLDNEEITKDVLIRPMLEALGYDCSNPRQVKAEYAVKHGKARGRADYVILNNGEPAIVVECKALGVELSNRVMGQMCSYANALGATAGIVTDGDHYHCFADTNREGVIDSQPYRSFQLTNLQDGDSDALELFSARLFSPKQLRAKAQGYMSDINRDSELIDLLSNPPMLEELYRIGQLPLPSLREAQLKPIIASIERLIRGAVQRIVDGELEPEKIVTTNEEFAAFLLCKGMLYGTIEPHRVTFRDAQSYASVFVDDNNRKPLCRFHFGGRLRQFGVFDAEKRETKYTIEDNDDILAHATALRRVARHYASN